MVKKRKDTLYPNKNIIKGALRRVFSRCPIVRQKLESAVHPTKKGIRGGKQYVCSVCKQVFPLKEVQVDHIKSVIPYNKTIQDLSYDELVARIFCKKQNLQVLCKQCHALKTTKEREKKKAFIKKHKELGKTL